MKAGGEGWIVVIEAPLGSDLYRKSLALREAVLRQPLGLHLNEDGLADDARRRHFCAVSHGAVVGSVSLKPLGADIVQLKQMAVAEDRRRERIGTQLLDHAERYAQSKGFRLIVLNARLGAEGFYAHHGYTGEGEPFDENTIPHIRMTKRLG